MRKSRFTLLATTAVAALSLFSCMSKDYDLSNIDKTMQVDINDLTLPINVDTVKLKTVLNLDDDSEIKEFNGGYAYTKDGEFHSNDINVNPISITKPQIDLIKANLPLKFDLGYLETTTAFDSWTMQELIDNGAQYGIQIDPKVEIITFDFSDNGNDINLNANNIDKAVEEIEKLTTDAELVINIKLQGISDLVKQFNVKDVVLELPAGLNVTNNNAYDPTTGKYKKSYKIDDALNLNDIISINAINYAQAEKDGAKFSSTNHTFVYKKFCKASSGTAVITWGDIDPKTTLGNLKAKKGTEIKYEANIGFSKNITINKFSGKINYSVDGVNIDPISLSSLPDFLKKSGTKLLLTNPQLYVKATNPLPTTVVNPTATIEITRVPSISGEAPLSPDVNPVEIKNNVENVFCFSPSKPDAFFDGFSNADYKKWSSLTGLLAYENVPEDQQKIPDSLEVGLTPSVKGQVTDFELKSYGKLDGKYTFYAPLQLTEEARIAYTDSVDGWNSENVDNMTINTLRIEADTESDFALYTEENEVLIYPLVFETPYDLRRPSEKPIILKEKVGKGTLSAGKGRLNITINGPITQLDGIYIKVVAHGTGSQMKPDQHIILRNIKATVGGSYTKIDDKN